MKTLLSYLFTLTLLNGWTTAIHAKSLDSVYQVEVIVFERSQRPSGNNQEPPSTNIELTYPSYQIELLETGNTDSLASEPGVGSKPLNTFLGPKFKTLEDKKNALQRRGFRILFHQTWLQELLPSAKSPALPIRGGQKFGLHTELEGYLTLSLSNFPFVESNLWLTEFVPNSGQTHGNWPQLPSPNTQTDLQLESAEAPYLINNIAQLKHQRKLRSNELNYIDHPKMGLLIKVTPNQLNE